MLNELRLRVRKLQWWHSKRSPPAYSLVAASMVASSVVPRLGKHTHIACREPSWDSQARTLLVQAPYHQAQCCLNSDAAGYQFPYSKRFPKRGESSRSANHYGVQSPLPLQRSSSFNHSKRLLDRRKRVVARGATQGAGNGDEPPKDKGWWNPFGLFQKNASPASAHDSSLDLDGEPPPPSEIPNDAKPSFQPLGTRTGGKKKDTKVGHPKIVLQERRRCDELLSAH